MMSILDLKLSKLRSSQFFEKIYLMRWIIETRFLVLCDLYDVKRPISRGLIGVQLGIEKAILAYNLGYFD